MISANQPPLVLAPVGEKPPSSVRSSIAARTPRPHNRPAPLEELAGAVGLGGGEGGHVFFSPRLALRLAWRTR